MNIAGIEKCSFVDYPGRLAAVLFTPGCNWDCYYCHNRAVLGGPVPAMTPWLDTEVTLAWLEDRRGFLDGVVISGGEPTLQSGLADFIRRIRLKGYLIKLDTNGSRPTVLRDLLDQRLVDYVAMDVKAPLEKYEAVCGAPVDHGAVHESIDLLLEGRVDYEFRTTVAPQLTEADIVAIARRIRGARRYVLQQYRRPASNDSDPRLATPPHPARWPSRVLEEIETLIECCETRGFDRTSQRAASSAA